jgi:hypothetical protein
MSSEVQNIALQELRDTSIAGLTNTCDKAVSVLRNTITSLGEVLRDQKFQPSQYKDVFAVPIKNLELGKKKLEDLAEEIRKQYQENLLGDDRYFCKTYFKVKDVKDWGYRFVDYAAATVALTMIVLEGVKAQESGKEEASGVQNFGVTGGLLILSKILSAATDYRNKKTLEKEMKKTKLLELKYRCDKANEAAAIIHVLQAVNRSIDEVDPNELRGHFKKSIRAIKEENGGVVSKTIAQTIKRELGAIVEDRIFYEAGTIALMKFKYEKKLLKKIIQNWSFLKFVTEGGADAFDPLEAPRGRGGDDPGAGVFDPLQAPRSVIAEDELRAGPFEPLQAPRGVIKMEPVGGNEDATGFSLQEVIVVHPNTDNRGGELRLTAELQYGTGTMSTADSVNGEILSPPNLLSGIAVKRDVLC